MASASTIGACCRASDRCSSGGRATDASTSTCRASARARRIPSIDSSDAVVDFVLELIDAVIGDEPFLLVGQSWGAYLARAVIAERRDRVLGVALDIPVVIAELTPIATWRRPSILREDPGILDGVGLIDAGEFREDRPSSSTRPAWDSFATTVLPAAIGRRRSDPRADRSALRVHDRRRRDRRAVRSPEPHRRRPPGLGRRLPRRAAPRRAVPTLDVRDPRCAGHLLEGERPALFAALVDDWLDRVERT